MREQKVGDIRAGYEQQKSHSAEKDQERGPRIVRDGFMQRHDGCVFQQVVSLFIGRVVDAARDRADLGIRLLRSYAVSQPPDAAVIVGSAAGILALSVGGSPHARFRWELEGFGKNADERVDGVIDFQVRSGEIRRRSQILFPVSVAGHSNWRRALLRIRCEKVAADHGLDAEDLQEFG